MKTKEQVRAARALIGWSQTKLADASGLSLPTIKRMERDGLARSSVRNADSVVSALESAGVEFISENGGGPGVRLTKHLIVEDPND